MIQYQHWPTKQRAAADTRAVRRILKLTWPGNREYSLSSDRSTGTCCPPCSGPASKRTDWAFSLPLLSQQICPNTVTLSCRQTDKNHDAVVTSWDLIELCHFESEGKVKTKGWFNNRQKTNKRWHIITCAGRDTGENSSTWKWDLRHSPRSSIFSVNTFESGNNEFS